MTKLTHFEKTGTLCVLSIDDDAVNLMVIEQLLSQEGWKVVSAQDGDEAQEFLLGEDSWPDFIFLDYQMNVGDSGDLICRKLRAMFGPTPVPIVMCTAMGAGSEAIAECRAAGATDFLLKPFEREKMLEKVHLHCQHKVAARGNQQGGGSLPHQHDQQPQQHNTTMAPPAHAQTPPQQVEKLSPEAKAQSVLLQFCADIGLEYCGKKLAAAGYSLDQVLKMDDHMLRKAGIVVQGQRSKILQEAAKFSSGGNE